MKALWWGLVIAACLGGCRRGEPQAQAVGTERPASATPPQPGAIAPPGAAARQEAPAQQATPAAVNVGGAAVCRPTAQVAQAASSLIEMADADGDGRVSKDEALSAANFLVGGFFFRADANGDGTVTPEEGRKARSEFMRQHPALASLVREVRTTTGQKPLAVVAQMLDIEYSKPLTMPEARDAARAAVNDLFGWVDADHDGYLTAAEARAAADQGARALGHAVFLAADTDHNGRLSFQEFTAALQGPARMAFDMADSSKNGQLTEDEAAAALGQLTNRLGIQEPARSK